MQSLARPKREYNTNMIGGYILGWGRDRVSGPQAFLVDSASGDFGNIFGSPPLFGIRRIHSSHYF